MTKKNHPRWAKKKKVGPTPVEPVADVVADQPVEVPIEKVQPLSPTQEEQVSSDLGEVEAEFKQGDFGDRQ